MATIRKLPSGKWNVQVRRNGHSISKTFTTKVDADKWTRLTEADIDRKVFKGQTKADSMTLADGLAKYVAEVTPRKKGAAQERLRIAQWLQNPLAEKPMSSLKPVDFAQYRDKRLTSVSHATVRLELAVISHLFTVAIKEWSLEGLTNPVAPIRKPKPSNPRSRRLSNGELSRLLEACSRSPSPLLSPLVELALETAMRLGEMLKLTWGQLNLADRTISLSDTKNGDDRTIPLSARAIAILESVPRNKSSDRVFHRWSLRSDSINTCWTTARSKAGINDFRFHDLRHEATSRLFELGLNPIEVASITGHKSMQMLKRYTHPRVSDLVKKLDGTS